MAFANTDSIETNLNQSPYYDDFNENKNFHRMLFRPGFAVQARELTGMQSMLQNQIDRFASHVFKEGSIVHGCEFLFDFHYNYVKLRDEDLNGTTVTVTDFANKLVTGVTSNVQAIVVNTTNGSEAEAPNYKTLYIKYTATGTNNTTKTFTSGERLTANNSATANVITSSVASGNGAAFTIGEGVVFAKDHFVHVPEQTIILEKYNSYPSYKVGFEIRETIIDSDSDSTLYDPAQGSPNEAAPGATRLKLNPVLVKRPLNDTANTTTFTQLFTVVNGVLTEKAERTQYSQVRDELARRTYDESGNYVVTGAKVRLREHLLDANNGGVYTSALGGNTNQLIVNIDPGKIYVHGYDYETLVTQELTTDKGLSFTDVEQQAIPANYGNYTTVNEVTGFWDIKDHSIVELRNQAMNSVSNTTYSGTSPIGNKIGEARVRSLEYSSGTPGTATAQYKLYLYDIQMSNGAFANVKSVYYDHATKADGKADIVLSANIASMQETSFNRSIFNLPASYVRRIRDENGNIDTTFRFLKSFDVTIATDGTFSVATGEADEQYPYSTGALNATQKRAGFTVVLNADADSTQTGTVTCNTTSNTINGEGTNFSLLNAGEKIKIDSSGEEFVIHSVTDANTLVVTAQPTSAVTANVFYKHFEAGEIIDMGGTGTGNAGRSVTVASTTSANYDIDELTFTSTTSASVLMTLNKIDGQEAAKTYKPNRYIKIATGSHTVANTVGPWDLGFSDVFKVKSVRRSSSGFASATDGVDVTSSFTLDNGQRDNFYQHGKLKIKTGTNPSIANGDWLLVKLDYFDHDTSQGIGYFSVDSYPIDDANTANAAAITTKEIPRYTSPSTGNSFRLRDCIDIRPRITDTSTDATTVGTASINPAVSTTMETVSGGLHHAVPNENFTIDLSYYLPRRDIVVMNKFGKFRVIKGISDLSPITPETPADSMLLARLHIAPYPSISKEVGKTVGRPDLANEVTQLATRRYTMRDIDVIKKRVDSLEYYVSLNMLEKDTADLTILDGNGLERFKNGILVDPFSGHGVGNVFDPDYAVAIDPKRRQARPKASINDVSIEYSAADSTNIYRNAKDATVTVASSSSFSNGEQVYQGSSLATASAKGTLRYQTNNKLYVEQTTGTFATSTAVKGNSSGASSVASAISTPSAGKLAVLPYTHRVLQDQPYASTSRVAAAAFWNWRGVLNLDPAIDNWVDTQNRPDVQVNFDGNLDAWEYIAESWETEWDSWQTVWTGTEQIGEEESSRIVSTRRGRTTTTSEITTTESTFLTTQDQTRTGIKPEIVPETETQRLGDKVVNISIIPYIRSREVKFTAIGMKPNSKLYLFFDNVDVSSYVTPANSSFGNTASEGANLVSDSNGYAYGLFRIPNEESQRFTTGTKKVRLTDSSDNSSTLGSVTTSADAQYVAQGIIQEVQDTVISTQKINFEETSVSEQRTVQNEWTSTNRETRVISVRTDPPPQRQQRQAGGSGGDGGGDPLAQSFLVSVQGANSSAGTYLSKIDIFFQEKDSVQPITLELRTVNAGGQVTNAVIPYSRVTLPSADINTSTDSSSPTPFVFESPVYLQEGQEYAFVLRPGGNSPNYRVWTAKLGDTDTLTSRRIIKQPAAGVMYASANDRTWTAIQDEDIKYKIYHTNFGTSTTGYCVLKSEQNEYFSVANVSADFTSIGENIHGETRITVSSLSGTANVGDMIFGNTSGSNGVITDISGSVYRVKSVPTTVKFTTGEPLYFAFANTSNTGATATLSSQTTPTGKLDYFNNPGGTQNTHMYLANSTGSFSNGEFLKGQKNGYTAKIINFNQLQLNTIDLEIPHILPQESDIDFEKKLTTTAPTLDTAWTGVNINNNTDTLIERRVLGVSDEEDNLSSAKSAQFRATLSTFAPYVSPAIDIGRSHFVAIGNLINNDSTGEANTAGGNALARYITRKVTFDDGQDAEDLRVYLTAYNPAEATIKVYYKILHAEDSDTFDEVSWVEMSQTTATTLVSDSINKNDFKEFQWDIATANKTGTNGEVQYVNSNGVTFTGFKHFAIKVVLLSSSTSVPPLLKDLRCIGLQI